MKFTSSRRPIGSPTGSLGALAALLLLGAVAALFPSTARATLATRSFVASNGSDTNPCTRTKPCRTFPAAIALTQAKGEVIALDSAGYGPLNSTIVGSSPITKSISLIAPEGIYAGVTATTGTAIVVDGAVNDTVVLRGLAITGLGGDTGVEAINNSGLLYVEKCVISGFQQFGIFYHRDGGYLSVKDTVVRNINGGGLAHCINVQSTSTNKAQGVIENSQVESAGGGIVASSNGQVTAYHCVASRINFGFFADGGELNMYDCAAVYNSHGTAANTGGKVRVARSIISNNTVGIDVSAGGDVGSQQQSNQVQGNGSGETFSSGFFAQ